MEDIKGWLDYLPSWNGISAFQDDEWHSNDHLETYTDSCDIAIGVVYGNEWFYELS